MSHSDAIDLVPVEAGLLEGLVDHRDNPLDVAAGRDFRHHSAIWVMQLNLAGDNVARQLTTVDNNAGGRLVATGLNP